MFSFYDSHNNSFYNKLVELSRNIHFYKSINLKDEYKTRINLILIHFSIIIEIYKIKHKKKFPQKIYDNVFLNIEYNLRELGFGDVSVNKKMKDLNKLLYDLLLKLNLSKDNEIIINTNIIYSYFDITDKNDKRPLKLAKYLENFYSFCFELDDNKIISGKFNFIK